MTRRTALVLALVALLVILVPAYASAADATEYQLQLSPVGEEGRSQLIVTVVLDPAASLPATVSVPVPAGATVLWSGELLGGDPGADPYREATVTSVGGVTVCTFRLEQSSVGQVELELGAPTVSGSKVRSSLVWTNPGPEVRVSGSVVAEPGATGVDVVPSPAGESRTNDVGETLYPLGEQRVPTGASYTIDVSWRRSGQFPLLEVLAAVLVLAVVALVLVLARERARARRAAIHAERRAGSTWE